MAYEIVGYEGATLQEGASVENIGNQTFATREEAQRYILRETKRDENQRYEERFASSFGRRLGYGNAEIRETQAPTPRTFTSQPLSQSKEEERRESRATLQRRQAGISFQEERQLEQLQRAKEQGQISERSYQELASNIANKEELEKIAVADRAARERAAAMRMDNVSQPKDDLDRIRQEVERGAQQNAGQALKALPEEYRTPENVRRVGEYSQQVEAFQSTRIGPATEALNRAEGMLGVNGSLSSGTDSGNSVSNIVSLQDTGLAPYKEGQEPSRLEGLKRSFESTLEERREEFKDNPFLSTSLGAFGIVASTAARPVEAVKSTIVFGIDLGKSAISGDLQGSPEEFLRRAKENPSYAAGEVAGGFIVGRGVAKAVEAQPFRIETVEVQTPQGARKVTVVGGEIEGRSVILGGAIDGKPFIGRPSVENRIPFLDITQPVAAPRTASATKALTDLIETTPEDVKRVAETQSILRQQRRNPGEKVDKLILNLEEPLNNPKKSARIIDVARSEEGGIIFGSTLFQQLPEGFRRQTGDIDVIFPRKTEQELFIFTQNLAGKLRNAGEDVRVSEKNPLIIERTSGAKLLEAKSGVNPSELSGPEVANVGGLGFDFPNLKRGAIGDTVPFGEGKAILAGEQLIRKGVASTFFRGLDERAPEPFQEGGIFPIGRRTKDLPDFVLQTRGLIAIDKASVNPFQQARALKTEAALEDFLGTFKPEQRLFIEDSIAKNTGKPIEIIQSFEPSPRARSPGFSPFGRSPAQVFEEFSSSRLSEFENDFSPSARFASPSISPRQSIFSDFGSPSSRFNSPSSPSARSPSPRMGSPFSPLSPNQSPSEFLSPSPSFSPSPSRFGSPSSIFSPSPSPRSPFSPSPSPSPNSPFTPPTSAFGFFPRSRSPRETEQEAYDVYLRRGDKRGDKFVKIADDLPYNKAVAFGANAADGNIENSFRVVRDGTTKESDDFFAPDLSKFRFPKGNTKLPTGTFVEKNMFRLDTQNELDQISYFKKAKNNLFGFA